ncbi:MarR family winged helix-turn-helix transcriptional regulator [Microbacterium forte]|uniref:MarR family winged helix-turn-helix transcriptional regulator n=1 Tax=Microbacterium forte TaxID=2982533 RepID=UPI002892A493|nr:MarR family transcriptional regulator [Microbacterium sp. A(2022)]
MSSLLRHAVEKQLRDVGKLSYVQFQRLARLGDAPDRSQRMTDLADGVVYSRSGLTYQAQSLEERGLVTRGPSPEDERSAIVTITDEGRDVLVKVFPGHIEAVKTYLFESLSTEGCRDAREGEDSGERASAGGTASECGAQPSGHEAPLTVACAQSDVDGRRRRQRSRTARTSVSDRPSLATRAARSEVTWTTVAP